MNRLILFMIIWLIGIIGGSFILGIILQLLNLTDPLLAFFVGYIWGFGLTAFLIAEY